MTKRTILFLGASPSDIDPRALDREARSIRAELKRSGYRDRFEFVTRWAAEPLDLLRELRELKPAVVHFSGHGVQGKLQFHTANGHSRAVAPETIAEVFSAAGASVKLVVLSACYVEATAEALLAHVDCVVGFGDSVHHDAARSFAIGFYGGLGEHESIAAAYRQGNAAISLEGLEDAERPRLKVRNGFDATQLVLAAVAGPVCVELPCPYPGMRPYSADEAAFFHGRSAEIDELLARLRANEREIYVIGPSGSGKSSLVAAGLLPRLARGVAGLAPFVIRSMRPGEHPVARLRELLEVDPEQPLRPANAVSALLAHRGPSSSLLVVMDQLEELFTLARTEDREPFVAMLRGLRIESRCAVIFTLRADFFGAFMESPLWTDHQGKISRIEVGPLHGDALRRAIALPASDLGVVIEAALIERLLADAAGEPGILPLVQETMLQLWDRRARQTLTLADYQGLGDGDRSGLAVALSRRADATLRALTPEQEAIARRIFLRLISFGEGRSGTRRQQPRSNLRAADNDPADFERVLQRLVTDRLLTIHEHDGDGEALVDLAHEVMIAAWPTLAGWIQQHRTDEQRRRQLEAAALKWVEHKRGARGLLDPIELAEAEAWQRTESARELGQSDGVMALIEASRTAYKRQRRRRQCLIIGAILSVAAIGLTIRAQARRELETMIANEVRVATTAFGDARQLAQQRDAARARAFGLFDAHRWSAGEDAWTEVEALAAQEASQYRAASSHFESALSLDPARASLRAQFADLTFERLLRAERDHHGDLAEELRGRLVAYDDGRHAAALAAGARVELEVTPPGTRVWSEGPGSARRLLGQAPLPPLTLPPGSLILSFEAPGRLDTRLPVLLARGETLRQRIALPVARASPPGMIYVPPGRFLFGSADDADLRRGFLIAAPVHEVQTEAYYIGRYEVTFAQWIEFLDDLAPDERRRRTPSADTGRSALALAEIAPRQWRLALRPTTRTYSAEMGQRLRYEHRTRRAEQDWTRFPVAAVSYEDAVAYAAWLDRTGRIPGARLCNEYEWERAARGADARTFPSGSALALDDANIDATYGRDPLAFGLDEVGSHPASRSPIGADDMAGNVWEWTRSVETENTPIMRGGGWYHAEINARSVNRSLAEPTLRNVNTGLRVCATPR